MELPNILAVDDEELFLELIKNHLKSLEQPYKLELANGGEAAWRLLEANPAHYDLVLLDRMMDDMDGIELLERIRNHQVLKEIPVILQTAKSGKEDILQGMRAGAYYYLTKPFDKDLILSVVNTALVDRLRHKAVKLAISERDSSIKLLKSATFEFKTIADANALASLLATICADPQHVVAGLAELLINAVEHGNLAISYQEKSQLRQKLAWETEIAKRLEMPNYRNRVAKVEVNIDVSGIEFKITDQGDGFDWQPYMEFSAERIMDSHGRGIAKANKLCFSRLSFHDKGNIVTAFVANKRLE